MLLQVCLNRCNMGAKINPRGGHLWVSCVPMREQKKNDENGYFFELDSAQGCHHLG